MKYFLHLSKEEQCKRFLAGIDQPDKNWIFSTADIEERKFWAQYMVAYEKMLQCDEHRNLSLVRCAGR
ncbi:hypothetical protein QZM52_24835 [Burkholderia metallica]|uniref:Polyphosphate kinase-2-related domain-containing protein n=1 Tax=Burkholderia metallica TaxID=488729 RepID=A0ABT8PI10_9BURK|nr:hypothetical protein [Burkholderia metallica]MDN7934517.1 hypothetical protein [Burkholderia metallica]